MCGIVISLFTQYLSSGGKIILPVVLSFVGSKELLYDKEDSLSLNDDAFGKSQYVVLVCKGLVFLFGFGGPILCVG